MRAGPLLTTQDDNLDKPVLMCAWNQDRCMHFSVYDAHQYYCRAQPDTARALRPGAGTHLWFAKPNERCPHLPDECGKPANVELSR